MAELVVGRFFSSTSSSNFEHDERPGKVGLTRSGFPVNAILVGIAEALIKLNKQPEDIRVVEVGPEQVAGNNFGISDYIIVRLKVE